MTTDSKKTPLAEQLRPQNIDEFIGQKHLIGDGNILNLILKRGEPVSLLFFGPPGCGKTTLANIISKKYRMPSMNINGVSFSTTQFKKIIEEANKEPILIIIDEIHRMNKAQQDALLPYIENGNVFIIGTTTENPSYEVNKALLSRLTSAEFERLSKDDLKEIIQRAVNKLNFKLNNTGIIDFIIDFSNCDARQAINIISALGGEIEKIETFEEFKKIINKKFVPHDKNGEEHYNLISAFHKSVRGSDVDASIYYFARMIAGGEDPLYVARRMIRIASEDIGNADPQAMVIAISAYNAFERLGSPEGELSLLQCAIYLSLAPKSTAVYNAYNSALQDAKNTANLSVPLKFRNPVTDFDKERGYGEEYIYPPQTKESFIDEKYFPDNMSERVYYKPVERGFEREMVKRIIYYKKLKEEIRKK
ncbi:TPA: AAA family ATPase [candidate division WOR-3 bacterium]|jgi:putative ATPase|uniref:AAA family ATPase n=1 Tax=candidate division WOR-3 bacterium TaxID=2052148 RepID=A0A350HAA9_UNCW3|nr:AAA family ATPase [candidate division WOR-3 bacterium]